MIKIQASDRTIILRNVSLTEPLFTRVLDYGPRSLTRKEAVSQQWGDSYVDYMLMFLYASLIGLALVCQLFSFSIRYLINIKYHVGVRYEIFSL